MSNSLLSFVGGMGAGAMSQYERNKDRARQDRQDDRLDRQEANAKQLHDAQMEEINRAKANRQADIEAASPVVEQEIPTVGLAPGEMGPSPTAPSLGGLQVGKDAYLDPGQGRKVAAAQNTPEGTQARRMQALRTTGRGAEADQLETTLRQGKLAELQLSDAQLANLDKQHNRALQAQIEKSGGDVFAAAATIGTETGLGGLVGAKVGVQLNPDGSRQFVTTGADGSKKLGKIYPKGAQGDLLLMQELTRADPATKIQWAHEREQARIAAEERAQAQDRWEKTFKQTDKHQEAQLALSRGQLGIAGGHLALQKAEEARKKFVFDQSAKIPEAVKTAYAALEQSAKSIDSALAKAQAEGAFRPEDPGAQQLLDNRTAISIKMSALLNPYIPAAPSKPGAAPADPLGILTAPAAAPAAVPTAAPATKPKMTAADMAKAAKGMPTKSQQ